MPITGYPLKVKYASGDSVFIFEDGKITPVVIASYKVKVSNPSGDGATALQETFYKFSDRGNLEIIENEVYASENALLYNLRGRTNFNQANESGSGGEGFFLAGINNKKEARSFGNWVDFAGFSFRACQFRRELFYVPLSGTVSITIGTWVLNGIGTAFLTDLPNGTFRVGGSEILSVNYQGALSDTLINCGSLALATWTNATIEKQYNTRDINILQGTIAMSSGSAQMIGTGTKFLDEVDLGDVILIEGSEALTVLSIESDTELHTTTNATNDWSDGEYSVTYIATGSVTFTEEIEGEKVLVFDYTDFTYATLPADMRTKADFWDKVKSADADGTLWYDGDPIGRPE